MALTFLGAIVLALVAVGAFALVVGIDLVRPAPVEAVAVTGDGRDLLVRYVGGLPGCGDPDGVDVAESGDTVVVSARTVARRATRLGFSCPEVAVPMFRTVRLGEPLGERTVRDGAGGEEVTVHDDVAALLGEG